MKLRVITLGPQAMIVTRTPPVRIRLGHFIAHVIMDSKDRTKLSSFQNFWNNVFKVFAR